MRSEAGRRLHRSLDHGLLLRPPRTDEADEVVEFVRRTFGETMPEGFDVDEVAGNWARDLLRGDHPTSAVSDHTIVVDTVRHQIVASCFVISQTWTYDGILFQVGRPELIATHPEYRGFGLVGAQMHEAHLWGHALGHGMQSITGIPYFYRRYGYTPSLIVRGGGLLPVESINPTTGEQDADFTVREATESDVPFITRMYEQACARSMIGAVRNETVWRYELTARHHHSDYWHQFWIVQDRRGLPAGCIAYFDEMRSPELICTLIEIEPDFSWDRVMPAILRGLRACGEKLAASSGKTLQAISFDWTPDHPAVAAGGFQPTGDEFAWYVRVPSLPDLLKRIGTALERRIAASPYAGFSGSLTVARYPKGLQLQFEGGHLIEVVEVAQQNHRTADAQMPDEAFLSLLFGSRTLEELVAANPAEVSARNDLGLDLLPILFPHRPSAIWPVA